MTSLVVEGEERSTILVEHYRRQGAPKTNKKIDTEFDNEISASAAANVEASKLEDSGSNELQRYFTID